MRRREEGRPDRLRRKLLKSSVLLGGAVAAGHALPYVKPGSSSFEGIPSAYAFQTPTFSFTGSSAQDPDVNPGEVRQGGIVINITATISPIPPLGTQIDCAVTSTDPTNAVGTGSTAGTDAAGVASFPNFSMLTGFPAPLVAVGSIVSFTFTFVDQATYGPSSRVESLTVVPAGG